MLLQIPCGQSIGESYQLSDTAENINYNLLIISLTCVRPKAEWVQGLEQTSGQDTFRNHKNRLLVSNIISG